MITTSERARLAAILGMLGSEHAGERAAAGLQAEAFRRKHGLTWEELLGEAAAARIVIPVAPAPEPFKWPPYPDDTPRQPYEPPYEPIQWRRVLFLTCFWTTIFVAAVTIL
ncbi:MAG TPA: hypothetical protein VGI78_01455 [Acetobacteraceae bacterium]|jgi:hypothetical protein